MTTTLASAFQPRGHARTLLLVATLLAPSRATLGAQRAVLTAALLSGDEDLGMPGMPAVAPSANQRLLRGLAWRMLQPGIAVATVDLRAGTLSLPVQAVMVRVEPGAVRFTLQHGVADNGMTGTWGVDSAGADAILAMNAGQFKETGPWGWLVVNGEERRSPIRAPLAIGIRIDSGGRMHWVPGAGPRDTASSYAFQSFPLLFFARRVPRELRNPALVDLGHRDARLILAETDDGAVLFILTRFAGMGPVAERLPVGLTTPESLALAAGLGARHAVMLDGGGSAQLMVRGQDGSALWWRGLRRVPLGLVATARGAH